MVALVVTYSYSPDAHRPGCLEIVTKVVQEHGVFRGDVQLFQGVVVDGGGRLA